MTPRIPPALALVAALAAGCTVGPDYRAPETKVPDSFGAAADGPAGPPVARWWTTLRDPKLDSLILRAVKANPDLRAAQARVREARARSGVASAEAFPSVDASGGASRVRTGANAFGAPGGTSNLFVAGFDAVWEIDVFGGVRRGVEAAEAEVAASVEDRRDVLVSLLAEVARTYVDLRGAQRQAVIARETLEAQRESLAITRQRLDAGLADGLDVARAEAQASATAATVPAFESEARRSIHALGVLLDLPPDALVEELREDGLLPAAPPAVPAGLPSDLLRRRPDVRRAERRLAAATARIGVATADLYPRFSLTGALGLSSDDLGNLVDSGSRTGSVGGAVRWPILDFGRARGVVEAFSAQEEQAAAAYESAVLQSLREVEDALVALAKEREGRALLAGAVESSQTSLDLANQRWRAGKTDFISVLDTQRVLFLAQEALVQSDRRSASTLIALYKALGGGWEIEASAGEGPDRGEAGKRVFDLAQPESR